MFLVRLRICDDHISDTNLKYFRYTLPTFIKGRMVTLGTKDFYRALKEGKKNYYSITINVTYSHI